MGSRGGRQPGEAARPRPPLTPTLLRCAAAPSVSRTASQAIEPSYKGKIHFAKIDCEKVGCSGQGRGKAGGWLAAWRA